MNHATYISWIRKYSAVMAICTIKLNREYTSASWYSEIPQGTVRVFLSFHTTPFFQIQFFWSLKSLDDLKLALRILFGQTWKTFGCHCYLYNFWLNIGLHRNREYTSPLFQNAISNASQFSPNTHFQLCWLISRCDNITICGTFIRKNRAFLVKKKTIQNIVKAQKQ